MCAMTTFEFDKYQQKYVIGGMDFIRHHEPLKFRNDDFEIPGQKQNYQKKEKNEYPVRRPGEQFGLDYSLHPAASNVTIETSSICYNFFARIYHF